jgi:hypothetical protein
MVSTVAAASIAIAVMLTPVTTAARTVAVFDTPTGATGSDGLHDLGGTHATRGVVKSLDETMLVIARSSGRGDMTFVLRPSTRREGTIGVGSAVSVRYREEGKTNIATAVALQRPRD